MLAKELGESPVWSILGFEKVFCSGSVPVKGDGVCPINESDCLIMQSKLEGRYPQRLNIIGETNSKQVQ